MNYGKDLINIRNNSKNGLYQNFNYQTEGVSIKNLILDTSYCSSPEHDGTSVFAYQPDSKTTEVSDPTDLSIAKYWKGAITFRTELPQELIVDKRSKIYIDTISLWNTNVDSVYFDIKQFPRRSYSNNPKLNGKYLITFENTSKGRSLGASITETQPLIVKGKKMNYFTTINSCKINELEFTLEGEFIDSNNIVLDSIFKNSDFGGRTTIELVIIADDDK